MTSRSSAEEDEGQRFHCGRLPSNIIIRGSHHHHHPGVNPHKTGSYCPLCARSQPLIAGIDFRRGLASMCRRVVLLSRRFKLMRLRGGKKKSVRALVRDAAAAARRLL